MHAALQVGSILLGKYRVEKVLGQGGMGVVVAARHEQLGELFAIKMMLPEALMYDDARERFMREARSAARLKSEHVARVHDVGTFENGAPYMIMEHLTGGDLSGVLDRRGPLPVGEAALYVYQACEAVAEAHALGIVHRDLKPSNMFLTRRPNETACVKVIDFGISKDLDPNKVGPALTKTGMIIGTPVYMAPEQMANNKAMDARSDIWALGIILYELVTGEVPFTADSMTELVSQVLTHHPPPPSRVRPGIPPQFDAVVMRCLDKRPDRRFASVRDLMAGLHPFVDASLPAQTNHPAPANPQAGRSLSAMGVPIGPHGLPRLNVTDATTSAQPLPFGANLPYIQTIAAPAQPMAPVPGQSVVGAPGMEPRQTAGAWTGPNPTASGNRGKGLVMVGIAAGALVGVGLAALVVLRLGASDDPGTAKPAISSEATGTSPVVALSASGAPVVSPAPAESAARVADDVATKLPDKPNVASSVSTATHNPGDSKTTVKKIPTSNVPDY